MGNYHPDATGDEVHVPGYVQESDPGAVGAGKDWFQPSTRRLRRRNNDNDGWLDPVVVPAVRTVVADAYGPEIGDWGAHVRLEDDTAVVVTLPADATLDLPVGFHQRLEQLDGPIDVEAEGADPDIRSRDGLDRSAGQYAVIEIVKVGANEWVLTGDLISSA